MTVAVVGATGYTGRLIVRELVGRGTETVAIGRSREKLDALDGDLHRRTADASDPDGLRAALDGVHAAVSCVGPFVDLGEPVVRACVDAGVHYLDTTGEQAFIRGVYERYGDAAVAVVPAIGFDYVPGDMGAALAAKALGTAPERVTVAYAVRGARSSDGTKRTGARVVELPCLVLRDGELVETRIGETEREYPFPKGPTHVALWPGGEVLTVPRHTGARTVEVYMRMPKVMARMARGAKLASPLMRTGSKALRSGHGPSEDARRKGGYTVVCEASAGDETARCVVEGTDMYGMTGAACAEALDRMTAPGFDRTGALAPSEAFDPEGFLGALSHYLTVTVEGP